VINKYTKHNRKRIVFIWQSRLKQIQALMQLPACSDFPHLTNKTSLLLSDIMLLTKLNDSSMIKRKTERQHHRKLSSIASVKQSGKK